MSETIIPLGKIVDIGEQASIGHALHQYVRTPALAKQLWDRHLLGLVKRHGGSSKESVNAIFKARRLHQEGTLGVYVLQPADVILGMATVDPYSSLQRQRHNMAPRLARAAGSIISKPVTVHGPEVTAWINPFIDPLAEKHLADAYRALKDPKGIAEEQFETFRSNQTEPLVDPVQAWTIEPFDSPSFVHRAIKAAGYANAEGNRGYYDDGESGRVSPPASRLYQAIVPLPKS